MNKLALLVLCVFCFFHARRSFAHGVNAHAIMWWLLATTAGAAIFFANGCASSHEQPATCPPRPTEPQCMAVIAHCPDLQLACEMKLAGACDNAKTICALEAACECE